MLMSTLLMLILTLWNIVVVFVAVTAVGHTQHLSQNVASVNDAQDRNIPYRKKLHLGLL